MGTRKWFLRARLVGSLLFLCANLSNARGQAKNTQGPGTGGGGVDTSTANNPVAALTQVQVQDWYEPIFDGLPGEGNELLLRLIVPFKNQGVVPSSIIRVALPVDSLPNGRSGLGDTQFIDFFLPGHHETDKLEWGIGPVFTFPSATNHFAGQGQFQVGPSAAIISTQIPKLLLGAIFDNPVTVSGERSRPGVNALTVEPLIVYSLPKKYFIRIDPYFQFNWKEHGSATLPVNCALGRLLKIRGQLINAYLHPEVLARRDEYIAAAPGAAPPKFTFRFVVDLLYPAKESR